jgi:hypothetical protein
VRLATHLHLVARLRMSDVIPAVPLYGFLACRGTTVRLWIHVVSLPHIASANVLMKLKGPSLLAACDKACESCEGDGPDMCTGCAQGYSLQDNMCVGMYILSCQCLDWKNVL